LRHLPLQGKALVPSIFRFEYGLIRYTDLVIALTRQEVDFSSQNYDGRLIFRAKRIDFLGAW